MNTINDIKSAEYELTQFNIEVTNMLESKSTKLSEYQDKLNQFHTRINYILNEHAELNSVKGFECRELLGKINKTVDLIEIQRQSLLNQAQIDCEREFGRFSVDERLMPTFTQEFGRLETLNSLERELSTITETVKNYKYRDNVLLIKNYKLFDIAKNIYNSKGHEDEIELKMFPEKESALALAYAKAAFLEFSKVTKIKVINQDVLRVKYSFNRQTNPMLSSEFNIKEDEIGLFSVAVEDEPHMGINFKEELSYEIISKYENANFKFHAERYNIADLAKISEEITAEHTVTVVVKIRAIFAKLKVSLPEKANVAQ
jgi:hypothetical protein